MRNVIVIGALAIVSAVGTQNAAAAPVADFQTDFQYSTPKLGWSYLWNAAAPIGTAAGNYAPLVPDGAGTGRYETQNSPANAFPDAAPGGTLSVTQTTVIPGYATGQDGNAFARYAIIGYTISLDDILAHGNILTLSSYSFKVSDNSDGGVTAAMYLDDFPIVSNQPLQPGIEWHDGLTGPITLGPIGPGMTFYVAIGADGVANFPPVEDGPVPSNLNDSIIFDFTLTLTPAPEPSSAAVMGFGAGAFALLKRTRRRVG